MGGPEVLDRAAFDDFAGLFDADELREVIADWHADSRKAVAAMSDALDRGDPAQVGELAHRAAGGAMALGATALASACERLRAEAESDGEVAQASIGSVRAAVEATYAAMTAAVGRGGAT